MNKQNARLRRSVKTRAKIREQRIARLGVYRTPKHTYAQIFSADGSQVLVSAASTEKALREQCKFGGNVEAAKIIGKTIAERAKEAGVSQVAFDRSGFKYHGRIKALADAARESGLEF